MWVSSVQRPEKRSILASETHKPSEELPNESPTALPTKHPTNFDLSMLFNKPAQSFIAYEMSMVLEVDARIRILTVTRVKAGNTILNLTTQQRHP